MTKKDTEMSQNVALLEEKINYVFRDKKLAETALTHSSYHNESKQKTQSNERLEFLGDAVLALIACEFLYAEIDRNEGVLTKLKGALVCENSLYNFAKSSNLGECILLGKGEKSGGLRKSTLADLVEAVLGAIYTDGGMEAAKTFILPYISKLAAETDIKSDYKSILQEVVQKNKGELLSYEIISEEGPPHDKKFSCIVKINSNIVAEGEGNSKKSAERAAAKSALKLMGIINN